MIEKTFRKTLANARVFFLNVQTPERSVPLCLHRLEVFLETAFTSKHELTSNQVNELIKKAVGTLRNILWVRQLRISNFLFRREGSLSAQHDGPIAEWPDD
jgi:hypothetical protein